MEEKKEVFVIHPMSSLDYGDILEQWNDSFNHDISNPTDQWRLVAYPVMPGAQTTQVALIFEQSIRVGEPECRNIYKYRILLYDMTVSPVLVNKSEFQFKDWELYTAWFFNNKLYVCMKDENSRYDVITVKGDGNEKVVELGRFVTGISTTTKGDILVGYDCCADPDDNRVPIMLFVRNGDNNSLDSEDAITCECVSIDAKDNIWAYVKPYSYICHMEGDTYETFPITLSGFSGIGVSDDGNRMLASISYKYYGARMYAFRKNEENRFCDEVEVVVDTEENAGKDIDSVSFAGNKAVLKKGRHLYMVNINELSWDETETSESSKKNSSNDELR